MDDATAGMLDQTAIRRLFADFDEHTAKKLVDAAAADITRLTQQLIEACEALDELAQQRARHSLAGVCMNFGASALLTVAAEDLSGEKARESFRYHSNSIVTALRASAPA